MKKVNKKGFSLIELILVLSVGTAITYIKFQDMRNEQNLMKASVVGEQIQKIGYAVNNYISLRYDKLSTLTPSTSQSSDPGPRTCSGNTCTITIQTLKNESILPASFVDVNAFKSPHTIVISRTGTSPNYVIDGLITTASAWIESGNNPRYDLLGYAMQKAGIDSGMTKSNIKVDGYNGNWSEKSSSFNNITKAGQLAFRVGYNASLYSAYLRRDGTLPMTGNLNMGGNDINNAKNITASGDITATGKGDFKGDVSSGGNVKAGNWIIAHNGYGDAMYIGGDKVGNNYEIKLNTSKPLTLWGTDGKNYLPSTDLRLQVEGKQEIKGDLSVNKGHDGKTTGQITASGNIIGSFLKANSVVTENSSCSDNGLISKNKDGVLLTCVKNRWASSTPSALSGLYSEYGTQWNKNCKFTNRATGSCSCSAGLKAVLLSRSYVTDHCSGSSHGSGNCKQYYDYIYACR